MFSIQATREKDRFETIYILEQHDLPNQKLRLVSERTVSEAEFRKKNGQLMYLENLKKTSYGKEGGGKNPEACPICQNELGTQWAVLQCGHCYCVDCVRHLADNYANRVSNAKSISCPVCRSSTFQAEISYVNTK